ncbi:hypothetical protein [Sporosarcina koreensis]|uniref:hypothetical protein n=1 Tax=Sporosarcina koreensis TaxID=334735 RepID=UPI000758C550|nr:hypothetical protein [Sporosarcina koreensis]
MGIECPCGVIVNAVSRNHNVCFHGHIESVKGDLTYMANVCVTMLDTSSLTLEFMDTESKGTSKSFLFEAKTFTSVTCCRDGENCEVTITGTGLVDGVLYPFEAVFREQNTFPYVDSVRSFIISRFFNQNGAAPVTQGSIIALGCRTDI